MDLLEATNSQRILLVAPAGYGKTTLARQWIEEKPRRGVWFRATQASTDVAALALGLAHAMQELFGGASARLAERLRNSKAPNQEADALAVVLSESVSGWPPDAWLVIDDYHYLLAEPAAESFVDALITHSEIPILITSRARPSWASAKRLLYGEIAEFGRNVLAMTHEEAAAAIPADTDHSQVAGLVALAEGWPAVIGLASLRHSPLVLAEEMPSTLYSYFAEELFQDLGEDVGLHLAQLSLAPPLDHDLAFMLFADESQDILRKGYESGFLNRDGDLFDLHPLLRQFLRSKLLDADPESITSAVRTICSWCLRRGAWDHVFALSQEFALGDLLASLLSQALDDLLARGRLATLEQWLDFAHRIIPAEEIVFLAEIELAFRKGNWPEVRRRAQHLARRLPDGHPLASRALFRAAQVAQLDDRQSEALELLSEARVRATNLADVRHAIWSRFITLTDLEEPALAAAALHEFEELPPESTEDVIRVSHGVVHLALRWGGIREQLARHRGALDLVERSTDPIVRSGFLQSYGTALGLAARYEEAYELADRQIAEARRFGLDWVRPHALELRGLAQTGLRNFEHARADLQEAAELAEAAGDNHAHLNAQALLARIPLAQGSPEMALALLEPHAHRVASPGMEAELRAIRALTLACLNRPDEADLEIEASRKISSHLEARGFRSYASFLIAYAKGEAEQAINRLEAALAESTTSGNADCFVAVYRAAPDILQIIRENVSLDESLLRALKNYDRKLGERAGLIPRSTPAQGEPLTDREKEVLALVRQGLSNRQIAHALWIAESTVKVHVRHIFDKLGVRSRTAAALAQVDDDA